MCHRSLTCFRVWPGSASAKAGQLRGPFAAATAMSIASSSAVHPLPRLATPAPADEEVLLLLPLLLLPLLMLLLRRLLLLLLPPLLLLMFLLLLMLLLFAVCRGFRRGFHSKPMAVSLLTRS